MSIKLTADVLCDHKGCCNKTTASVCLNTYSEYGHEYPYVDIDYFNDPEWTHEYSNWGPGEHYCPVHKPKEKKAKK